MKIAVMGAGGVGGYVGGRLADAGEEVHFIARGRHLEALKARGLRIESPFGDAVLPEIHASDDPAEIGPVDLVLFTVKLADTDSAAAALAPLVGPQTRIVTLQNGIDSATMIARHVPRDQIAAGAIALAARIREPGVIVNVGSMHRMTIDAMDGNATMAAFFTACEKAVGIEAVPTDEPERTVWRKFITLVALSGVTAITRLPIGATYANPDTLAFMRQLLDENIAVANASGQNFGTDDAEETINFFSTQPYDLKSSMLVDLENGKPLELPWLSGRIHQLGRELGIATPANSAVWAALCPYVDGSP
jgi:2-dehydropantoate 2-reductase